MPSAVIGLLVVAGSAVPAAPKTGAQEVSRPAATEARVERVITTLGDLGRGRFLRRITGRRDPELFQRPHGVAWRGEDLLVTDPGAGSVLELGFRRGVTRSAHGLFRSPIGVAVCSQGIVVSDSILGAVALLDSDLRLERWLLEHLDRPTGVACQGDRIFVLETGRHRLLALEPEGRAAPASADEGGFRPAHDVRAAPPHATAGERPETGLVVRVLGRRGPAPGEFNFPTTLALASGSLWIGDTLNFRLQRFDAGSGRFAGSFGQIGDSPGEMPRLKGLTVDDAGRLWMTDAYLDQIALYEPGGRFLTALGRMGSQPGELSFPAGIAAHRDGRVAVVDSMNRRLQILRLAAPPDLPGDRP